MVFIIERASGENEKFVVPGSFTGDIYSLLNIGSGDVIVNLYPLFPRDSSPVSIQQPLLLTPTPTSWPYPAPNQSSPPSP